MNKGYEETEPMESFHSFTQENIFSCNAEKNLIHTHIYIYTANETSANYMIIFINVQWKKMKLKSDKNKEKQ